MARNLTYILHRPAALAIVWVWGLFTGICAYSASGACLFSVMRHAPACVVSFPRLAAVTVFPFLISALAVAFSWSVLLLPIAFLKACTLSFVSMGCGTLGVPACCLLLFRPWAEVPLLYGFWRRHLSGEKVRPGEAAWLAAACLLLACTEHWFISPLLRRLIVW